MKSRLNVFCVKYWLGGNPAGVEEDHGAYSVASRFSDNTSCSFLDFSVCTATLAGHQAIRVVHRISTQHFLTMRSTDLIVKSSSSNISRVLIDHETRSMDSNRSTSATHSSARSVSSLRGVAARPSARRRGRRPRDRRGIGGYHVGTPRSGGSGSGGRTPTDAFRFVVHRRRVAAASARGNASVSRAAHCSARER